MSSAVQTRRRPTRSQVAACLTFAVVALVVVLGGAFARDTDSNLGAATSKRTGPVKTVPTKPIASTTGATARVYFSASSLSFREGAPAVVQLVFDRPAPSGSSISLAYEAGTASLTAGAFPADVAAESPSIIAVPSGAKMLAVSLPIVNDTLAEPDETFRVRINAVSGVVVGAPSVLNVVILDDDRTSFADVKAYGAKGDGVTDDGAAIQRALNAGGGKRGAVIVFPPGTYLVRGVAIGPGMTIQGYGATILRPPNQGKWVRTFTTENAPYEGDSDSAPLVIRGLTFDGSSQSQGPFQSSQLEQAHLIFLNASPARAGHLVSIVEDVVFRNGVADGLSLYTNTDTTIVNVKATDVFRGAVTLTGGASKVAIRNLVTTSVSVSTGIDVEIDGLGYGNSKRTQITLDNIDLAGSFDVAVADGSEVTIRNLISRRGPFFIQNFQSTMSISDSTFAIGGADQFSNRIVYPGNLTIARSKFVMTQDPEQNPRTEFYGLDVWWAHPSGPKETASQTVSFQGSSFAVSGEPSPLKGIVNRYRVADRDHLELGDTTFDPKFGGPSPVTDVR